MTHCQGQETPTGTSRSVAGNGVAVGVLRGAGKLSAWFDRLLTGLMDEEGRRRVLVIAALRAAMQRLDEAGADETKAFAGTAESLFWVVAADEAVRLGSGRDREWRQEQARLALLQALRYPRNVAAHESTAWQNTMVGGTPSAIGVTTGHGPGPTYRDHPQPLLLTVRIIFDPTMSACLGGPCSTRSLTPMMSWHRTGA